MSQSDDAPHDCELEFETPDRAHKCLCCREAPLRAPKSYSERIWEGGEVVHRKKVGKATIGELETSVQYNFLRIESEFFDFKRKRPRLVTNLAPTPIPTRPTTPPKTCQVCLENLDYCSANLVLLCSLCGRRAFHSECVHVTKVPSLSMTPLSCRTPKIASLGRLLGFG